MWPSDEDRSIESLAARAADVYASFLLLLLEDSYHCVPAPPLLLHILYAFRIFITLEKKTDILLLRSEKSSDSWPPSDDTSNKPFQKANEPKQKPISGYPPAQTARQPYSYSWSPAWLIPDHIVLGFVRRRQRGGSSRILKIHMLLAFRLSILDLAPELATWQSVDSGPACYKSLENPRSSSPPKGTNRGCT